MKVSREKLSFFIAQQSYPLYWISGDECLLVEEAAALIRNTLKTHQFTERQSFHVNNQFDWNTCLSALGHASLFGEKMLVELRLASPKINTAGQQALAHYLDHVMPDKALLIISEKLDSPTQQTKWFKTLDKQGLWIPVWALSSTQLPLWIRQRLQRYQLTAESPAITLIAEQTEGNLLATHQEIEKLHLTYGTQKCLTLKQVDEAIHQQSRYTTFALADSTLQGDAKRALKILDELQHEGAEPVLILWSLTNMIRTLIKVLKEIETGNTVEDALLHAAVRTPQKPFFRIGIKKHTLKTIYPLLKQAALIDRTIKGFEAHSLWLEFQKLILSFCQIPFLHE